MWLTLSKGIWLVMMTSIHNSIPIGKHTNLFSCRLPHSTATTMIPFATMSAGITLQGFSSLHNIELQNTTN